ncbi:MAG: hypothetical protein M1472_00445 [Planctomycetes bacterium]|nr:hypothetical protein [Planctomycetota bacterium]
MKADGGTRTCNLRFTKPLPTSAKTLNIQGKCDDKKNGLARCWARQLQKDKRLQNLLANWENLPEPIKAAIMAMVASVQSQ